MQCHYFLARVTTLNKRNSADFMQRNNNNKHDRSLDVFGIIWRYIILLKKTNHRRVEEWIVDMT